MLPLIGQLLEVNKGLETDCEREGNVIGSIFEEDWWKSVGTAAEFNLSLLIMRTISRGEMWMSEIVSFDSGGKRDGKGGRVPLPSVNTDWKYCLNKFALSGSDVSRLPWWSIKGAMPLELLSLALTNL